MQERSDQEWVRQLKQNSPNVIADLWEQLFTWALTLTRRYNQEEDIGRDGAVATYWRIKERGVYQYKFQGPFLGFCRRILVNEVHRRMKPAPATLDIDDPATPEPAAELPEHWAELSTVQARLQPCFDQLNTREREIITLLYYQEMSPQRVADQLGIARNNANIIAFRARDKLRRCLEGYGFSSSHDLLSL